jgi:hypothetical protein
MNGWPSTFYSQFWRQWVVYTPSCFGRASSTDGALVHPNSNSWLEFHSRYIIGKESAGCIFFCWLYYVQHSVAIFGGVPSLPSPPSASILRTFIDIYSVCSSYISSDVIKLKISMILIFSLVSINLFAKIRDNLINR